MVNISEGTIAILAGGRATRLKSLTTDIPKSLIPVAGRPFIYHQIDLLRFFGFRRFVLCTGYLGKMIEEAVGDGSHLGVQVDYSRDGEPLLGTAGALRTALPLLSEPFFVLYGDSYLSVDFRKVAETYRRAQRLALMTVYANENRWVPSNVWFEGGLIKAYDKNKRRPEMRHIDYGFSALSKKVFQECEAQTAEDLSLIFQGLLSRDQLAGYEAGERFYEIGSPDGLAELEAKLRANSELASKRHS